MRRLSHLFTASFVYNTEIRFCIFNQNKNSRRFSNLSLFIVTVTNKENNGKNIIMLVNKIDRRILKENLQKETFKRRTISFYKYFEIENPQQFRDDIYRSWNLHNKTPQRKGCGANLVAANFTKNHTKILKSSLVHLKA